MLIRGMGSMMERIGPASIHFLPSRAPQVGEALVKDVYAQMRRDFFVASPFMLHVAVPELLAGTWSLVRESLFTGEVDRGEKEILAWAISRANQCPFCVGAHHAAVRAARAEDEGLEAWAMATAGAEDSPQPVAPFAGASAENKAEYFATVVAFHYLNRMVSVFLDPKMMPVPDVMDPMADVMAQFMMGGMIAKGTRNTPGESLSLLPSFDDNLAWRPAWAEAKPSIAGALAGWSALTEGEARARLDLALLSVVEEALEAPTPDALATADLVQEAGQLEMRLRAPAELALVTARAPYRVDAPRVQAVLDAGLQPDQLLALVAWAAARSARQAGERAAGSLESATAS